MVIQNGACRLLVVTRSVANNHCICRRHRHRAHAHGHYVRLIWIDRQPMILRHRRNNNVLHYLTKFRGQVRIELSHRHASHLWSFIHISDHDLLIRIMVIQLWRRLLQNNLSLGNSRPFLATKLRRLICTLRCLIIWLTWLLYLLRLCWVRIQHYGCSCRDSWRLHVVVRVRLRARRGVWRPCLCVYLTCICWNNNCSTLSYHTAIETWIASSLERVLACSLVKLLMLCRRCRLIIVLC